LNLTVVLEVNTAIGHFMERVWVRCELIGWLHLIVASLLLKGPGRWSKEGFLHWFEDLVRILPHFRVSVEDLVAPESRRDVPFVLFAVARWNLNMASLFLINLTESIVSCIVKDWGLTLWKWSSWLVFQVCSESFIRSIFPVWH
jgi:hypothetical protein